MFYLYFEFLLFFIELVKHYYYNNMHYCKSTEIDGIIQYQHINIYNVYNYLQSLLI